MIDGGIYASRYQSERGQGIDKGTLGCRLSAKVKESVSIRATQAGLHVSKHRKQERPLKKFDFKDTAPKEALDSNGEFSFDLFKDYLAQCEELASRITQASDVSLVDHKVIALVDLQGVYLAMTNWFKERKIPLASGLIISRLAFFLLEATISEIKRQALAEVGDGFVDFDDLVKLVSKKKTDDVRAMKGVVKVVPSIELFYAPAPLSKIEWLLKKEAKNGSSRAARNLNDLQKGIVNFPWGSRDYSVYDHFVSCLKQNPSVTRSEEGFFNFFVGRNGLQFFDEKEVDIRIAVRAMDVCADYQADSLCIISSDQDFGPLHERWKGSGTKTFQADVAKFASQQKVGRKIKELGAGFIETAINPDWPLRVIVEASRPAMYALAVDEFEALCSLHNAMNEVKIAPHQTEGGGMSIKMYRPR